VKQIADAQRAVSRISSVVRAQTRAGIKKIAFHALKKLISETPKGYTGETRRSWHILNRSNATSSSFVVTNKSKIMKFLEEGTKAHGARTASALFVPLNRRTALGGLRKGSKFGKDFVFAKKVAGIQPMHIAEKRSRIVERQADRMINGIINNIKL